jgi:hypothetical protein
LGPSRPNICPFSTERLISSTAFCVAKYFFRFCSSSMFMSVPVEQQKYLSLRDGHKNSANWGNWGVNCRGYTLPGKIAGRGHRDRRENQAICITLRTQRSLRDLLLNYKWQQFEYFFCQLRLKYSVYAFRSFSCIALSRHSFQQLGLFGSSYDPPVSCLRITPADAPFLL